MMEYSLLAVHPTSPLDAGSRAQSLLPSVILKSLIHLFSSVFFKYLKVPGLAPCQSLFLQGPKCFVACICAFHSQLLNFEASNIYLSITTLTLDLCNQCAHPYYLPRGFVCCQCVVQCGFLFLRKCTLS